MNSAGHGGVVSGGAGNGDGANRGSVPKEMARIREILVGPQARETEARVALLGRRLTLEVQEIRHDMEQRIEALKASLCGEVNALAKRLEAEGVRGSGSIEELSTRLSGRLEAEGVLRSRSIDGLSAGLSERLGDLAAEFEEKVARMLDRVARHEEALRAEIANESQAVRQEHRQAIDELRESKANGKRLASIFAEFAGRLRQEIHDNPTNDNAGAR